MKSECDKGRKRDKDSKTANDKIMTSRQRIRNFELNKSNVKDIP